MFTAVFSLFSWLPAPVFIVCKFLLVAVFVIALAKLLAIVWDALPFV